MQIFSGMWLSLSHLSVLREFCSTPFKIYVEQNLKLRETTSSNRNARVLRIAEPATTRHACLAAGVSTVIPVLHVRYRPVHDSFQTYRKEPHTLKSTRTQIGNGFSALDIDKGINLVSQANQAHLTHIHGIG
jgi:hypothetical protein